MTTLETEEGEDPKRTGEEGEPNPDSNEEQPDTTRETEKDDYVSANEDGDDDKVSVNNKSEKDNGEEDNDEDEDDNDNDNDDNDNEDDADNDEDEDNASLNTADSRTNDENEEEGGVDGKSKSFGSHIPDHLDLETLDGITKYVKNFEAYTELDEDEIALMMTKADRNVENRARYAVDPLDEVVDEERLKKELYKEEEDYLVGHELIKEMHAKLQKHKKKRGYPDKRTVNWVKRAAGLNRKNYHTPHSAIGAGYDEEYDSDDNNGGTKKIVPKRYTRGMAEKTRIKKKQEFQFKDTIGLKSLLHSIEELEPEHGPYPVPFECIKNKEKGKRKQHSERKHHSERKRPAPAKASDDDESIVSRRNTKRRDRPSGPMTYPLVVRLPEEDFNEGMARGDDYLFGDNRDILLVKITVNGEHVEEDNVDAHTTKNRKRELKRLRDRQYQKRKRDQKIREKENRKHTLADAKYTTPLRSNSNKRRRQYESDEEDEGEVEERRPKRKSSRRSRRSSISDRGFLSPRTGKGSISLALLDWQRRQMWSQRQRKETERDVREKVEIPPHLAKAGIGFRLPPWESVNPASIIADQSNQLEPPRSRHSDEVYAAWTQKLINCLNGSARSWAIHEFFYSDIDRAWYNANPFARDVAKMGILPSTKLTRREWSAVRRMIPDRPRRFSKRFIYSQLRERNRYRNMVRQFQQNPDQTNQTGYAIPAPIKVGATVTAYNKKFLILHRGVVLLHDPYSARYLIQFERKELGFEFCSDTEVASHGAPELLVPPAPSILTGASDETDISKHNRVGKLPYGTCFGPASLPKLKDRVTCESEVAILLSEKPTVEVEAKTNIDEADTEDARAALVEKVAERETLVSLMTIVEAAITRKERLLELMEKFNVLLVDRLPFGEGPPTNHVMSGYFEKHYAWLRANLEVTNRSLDSALMYLQVMYGKAYSSTPAQLKMTKEAVKKMFVETYLGQDRSLYGGSPTVTVPWVGALHHGSQDVGNYLASLVCQEHSHSQNNTVRMNGDGQGTAAPDNGNTDSNGQPGNTAAIDRYLHSRMAAVGGLLTAVSYCCGRASESDITAPDDNRPLLDVVLASNLEKLAVPVQTTGGVDKAHESMLTLRESAERELKESFALLSKEFTAINVIKRARSQEPNP